MLRSRVRRRSLVPAAFLVLCLAYLPHPLQAARLQLRAAGGSGSLGQVSVLVGDILDVDVWVDSEKETLAGAAIFLSYDGDVFTLAEQDRDPAVTGFQPFAPGRFLGDGEIFRNTRLAPDDPAALASGEQLDYSIVRAVDRGAGAVASFRLRAVAPAAATTIRIDESGIRETRVFLPDGSHRAFRFIEPLKVTVRGISIEDLPPRVVLARGQVDSTTFRLDDLLFDPLYDPDQIDWQVEASAALDVRLDPDRRTLVVRAPGDRSLWEPLTLRAVNPDGQTAAATVDLFVNAGPVLGQAPAAVDMAEDGTARIALDPLVDDPDEGDEQLTWAVRAAPALGARVEGPPFELVVAPAVDWFGDGRVHLTVSDRFGFADSAAVEVHVAAVNDAPTARLSPNLRITRGKADSSLSVTALFVDADDAADSLRLSWEGAEHVTLQRRGDRLQVTAPADWEGTEAVRLSATDAAGATAATTLTVTVVASLAPTVTGAPQRLGLAPGSVRVLDLTEWIHDPDDAASDLVFAASGARQLDVLVSSTGAARIEAPAPFTGTETVRFHAVDPSGASTAFDLLVFSAPATGEPVVAPLPELSLPAGGVDASIDLDDFVFDLDDRPEAIVWSVDTSTAALDLRVDPASHVLTVSAADSARGSLDVTLRAVDPAGHETTAVLRLTVVGGAAAPPPAGGAEPPTGPVLSLAPVPTVRLAEGSFDRSLVVDDYVDAGDAAAYRWEALPGQHVQALIDPETRRVTVLAETGWTGPDLVTLRALDEAGQVVVEALVGVQVRAVAAALDLRDLVEAVVLQGDSSLSLDPSLLLAAGPAPERLTWAVRDSDGLDLRLQNGALRLRGPFDEAGDRIVTVVASDSNGLQASGKLMLRVLPADGSVGAERDGFRIAVVPNPVEPTFLDVFVRSDLDGPPRLRTYRQDWRDLALTPVTAGIWHAPLALATGMEGRIAFLALDLEGGELVRHRRDLVVGTASAAAGKTVAIGAARLVADGSAFTGEAVLALIPEGNADAGELRADGDAVRVHATRTPRAQVHLTLRGERPESRIYRRQGDDWRFVGGRPTAGGVTVALDRLGTYALFSDTVPPRVDLGAEEAIAVRDAGSGVATVAVYVDGRRLDGAVIFDGGTARLTDRIAAGAAVELRAVDRAGNTTVVHVRAEHRVPADFRLGANYPNPFNPQTTIPVVGAGGPLRLEIFSAAGQRIRLLVDGELSPGEHRLVWDGRDASGRQAASGTYLVRAVTPAGVQVRRLTLLR